MPTSSRDWRIYASSHKRSSAWPGRSMPGNPLAVELANTVYALDTTTIDLCPSLFPWAPLRATKAAIKLYTLLDLRCAIPTFLHISDGKVQCQRPGYPAARARRLCSPIMDADEISAHDPNQMNLF